MSELVSIVLPVFNQQSYIKESIHSILQQTYRDFELIIINDASTDNTVDLITEFSDSRIILLHNAINEGLASSVNKGIRSAKGKYIARMDADDISLPNRLEKQVNYLIANSEVSIVGSAMQSFGHFKYLHRFPLNHQECKAQLLFNVCFGHPTVMFRKEVFDDTGNFYLEELRQYSEEYELWCRLVDKLKFANLPDVLLYYRTFDESIKIEASEKRKVNSLSIRKEYIITQLGEIDEQFFHWHDSICNLKKAENYIQLKLWLSWFDLLVKLNSTRHSFHPQSLDKVLSSRKFEMYYWNSQLGFAAWLKALISNSELRNQPLNSIIKYLIRSLLIV